MQKSKTMMAMIQKKILLFGQLNQPVNTLVKVKKNVLFATKKNQLQVLNSITNSFQAMIVNQHQAKQCSMNSHVRMVVVESILVSKQTKLQKNPNHA